MKATKQLKDEHEGIKIMLSVMGKIAGNLEQGGELNRDHFTGILGFLKGFTDQCHHGKEEGYLFPAMVKRGIPEHGGPVGVMLHEHRLGREYVAAMSRAFEDWKDGDSSAAERIISAVREYVDLLRNHIEKENNILFNMADQVLDEREQQQMANDFEKLEQEETGPGKHEEYHRFLKEMKETYLT
ncbi:MAG: hemerythrin domain-containing protein [Bacteroidales bacterium]